MPLSQPARIPGFTVGNTMPEYPNVGDIWIERNSSEGVKGEWFWSGALWLSTATYIGATQSVNISASLNGTRYKTQSLSDASNVYLVSLLSSIYTIGAQDSINHWKYSVVGITETASGVTLAEGNTINYNALTGGSSKYINTKIDINLLLDLSSGTSYPNIQINFSKVNSPTGSLLCHSSLICRLARA
jgi:hypothetical protein